MVGLVFVCMLNVPASPADVQEFIHCSEYVDQWNLGTKCHEVVSIYFEPEDHAVAYKIIGCESWGVPTAKNPTSTATGLWQFISKTWTWVESKLKISGSPTDPYLSTRFAAWLFYNTNQGAGHWAESAFCWEVSNGKKNNNYNEIY